jgi:hypothetical protein
MRCEHPQCTGTHDDNGSIVGLCPRTIESRRRRQREYWQRKYDALTEREYNEIMFRQRRYKAVRRMKARRARGAVQNQG